MTLFLAHRKAVAVRAGRNERNTAIYDASGHGIADSYTGFHLLTATQWIKVGQKKLAAHPDVATVSEPWLPPDTHGKTHRWHRRPQSASKQMFEYLGLDYRSEVLNGFGSVELKGSMGDRTGIRCGSSHLDRLFDGGVGDARQSGEESLAAPIPRQIGRRHARGDGLSTRFVAPVPLRGAQ